MAKSICDTCQYAANHSSMPAKLECRRFPPTVLSTPDEIFELWPEVDESDWCGEYVPRGRRPIREKS